MTTDDLIDGELNGGIRVTAEADDLDRPPPRIAFHENETFRVEIGRRSIIDRTVVNARDCDVLIDGQRLHGVQAALVVDGLPHLGEGSRAIAVMISPRDDAAVTALDELVERSGLETVLRVARPDTGATVREYRATGCRVLKHDGEIGRKGRQQVVVDFIGEPA